MSKLQDWTRKRNLEKGRIASISALLRGCITLTFRERAIANLCIDYLSSILSRWEISSPTSKREHLKGEKPMIDLERKEGAS